MVDKMHDNEDDIAIEDDGRIQIPLRMYAGNIDVMLEHRINVQAVSFVRDPLTRNGVILMFHGADHAQAAELGFKLGSPTLNK